MYIWVRPLSLSNSHFTRPRNYGNMWEMILKLKLFHFAMAIIKEIVSRIIKDQLVHLSGFCPHPVSSFIVFILANKMPIVLDMLISTFKNSCLSAGCRYYQFYICLSVCYNLIQSRICGIWLYMTVTCLCFCLFQIPVLQKSI